MKQTIFAALALAVTISGALAHSKAEQTTPANEAVVQTVEVLEMRFDGPMRVTAFSVTGPDGEVEIERETGTDPVMEFRAFPTSDLPHGSYSVDWRGLAEDGHPMQGSFGFTLTD